MDDDVLTIETLKRGLERMEAPMLPPLLGLHSSMWEDYKKALGLTDEQMNKIFIKVEYLK